MTCRTVALAILLSVLAAPLVGEAQLSKVGYLSVGSASDPRRVALFGAFRQGLRDMGYVDGKNIVIEARFGEGNPTSSPVSPPSWLGSKSTSS